jgi:PPP family 3-phenylpropionic acid transporter
MNMKINAIRIKATYFLVYSAVVCFIFNFSFYLKRLDLSGSEIGIIMALPFLVLLIFQPFVGIVSDKFGYKKVLLISLAITALLFMFFPSKGSFLYAFIVTFFLSIGYNAVPTLVDCIVLEHVQEAKNTNYSMFRLWGSLGIVTFAFINSRVEVIENPAIFLRTAAAMMALAFINTLFIKSNNSQSASSEFNFSRQGLIANFKNKSLIVLLITVLVVAVTSAPFCFYLNYYYTEMGAPENYMWYPYGIAALIEIPFYFTTGWFISKLGIRKLLAISFFVTAIRLFLYFLIKTPNLALLIELTNGISFTLFWVACVEYVNQIVSTRYRATAQSLLYATYNGAGFVIGNYAVGFLTGVVTIRTIFLYSSIVLFAFTIVLSVLLIFKKQNHEITASSV